MSKNYEDFQTLSEFDGNCPECGNLPDFLETKMNDEIGLTCTTYFCSECNIKIVVVDDLDEILETYEA